MRSVRGIVAALATVLALPSSPLAAWPGAGKTSPADERPNVVLVLVDDLGPGELQWYPERADLSGVEPDPGDAIRTPHLFALARDGLRFTSFYANGPVCSPTRAALLTGRYPQAFGLRRVYPWDGGRGLPDVPTLASLLAAEGYRTGHFGKWHLGDAFPEYLPVNRGFHESLTLRVPDGEGYRGCEWIVGDDLEHPRRGPDEHSAKTITDAALAFVQARCAEERSGEGRPFFLNVWYRAPHVPLDPPAEFPGLPANVRPASRWELDWRARAASTPGLDDHGYQEHDPDPRAKERALYAASVSWLDAQIGRLVAGVDALFGRERTLVVFTSDNGPDLKPYARARGGRPPGWQPKGSLREGKGSVFEGGIRAPFFVRWAGRVAAGGTNDSVSATFDLVPTLLALVGAEPPRDLVLDGQDVSRAWLDGALVPRDAPLFFETKASTVRFDPGPSGELNRFAVRDDLRGRKLVVTREPPGPLEEHLFGVARRKATGVDEADDADLASEEPEVVAALREEYRAWRRRTGFVEHRFDEEETTARIAPEGIELRAPDEVAVLEPGDDLRFRDADFTFRAVARFERLPAARAVVAEHPGSWSLAVTPAEEGRFALTLDVVGKDPRDPSRPGRPGAVVRLAHALELAPGAPLDVAFTVFGWRFSESTVRLYVGGEPVAAHLESPGPPGLPEVFASDAPLLLGNSVARNAGWIGELRGVELHRACLTPHEVRTLGVGVAPVHPRGGTVFVGSGSLLSLFVLGLAVAFLLALVVAIAVAVVSGSLGRRRD